MGITNFFPALRCRQASLILFVVGLVLGATVYAEPQVVTGFSKIVDGTTPIPTAPASHFYHDYFFPDVGSYPPGTTDNFTLSNDGTNTAFLGCTADVADAGCETNELGSYYGSGGPISQIISFNSSGAIPITISLDGDIAASTACLVAFGCAFDLRVKNIDTQVNELVFGAIAFGMASDPLIVYAYPPSGVYIYHTDWNGTVTVADTATTVPLEGQLFTNFDWPDISGNGGTGVTFRGQGATVEGLFTNEPGWTLRRIVSNNQFLPGSTTERWSFFGEFPAISGVDVVFVGVGTLGTIGIWKDTGGTLTQIVDYVSASIIAPTAQIDISDGTVAFGVDKIVLWNDGDLTTVIQPGDMLDGKTVSRALVMRGALADNSLAFPVLFTDGQEAIYVANFGPATTAVDIDVHVIGTPLHVHHQGQGGLPDDTVSVAVVGTSTLLGDPEDLDVTLIDPASLRFGPSEAVIDPASTPDLNYNHDGDGTPDAKFEFLMSETGFTFTPHAGDPCSASPATLVGEVDGLQFTGTDASVSTKCDAQCHN
jgi:hypothetical protein